MRVISAVASVAVLAGLLGGRAEPVLGQIEAQRVDAHASVGFNLPTRDLGVLTITGIGAPVQFSNKLDPSPVFLAGITVPLPETRASLRFEASYSGTNVVTAPSICDGPNFDCTDFNRGEADASIITIQGGAVVHSSAETSAVRPYLLAGLALRRYAFDDSGCDAEQVTCDALTQFLSDQFRPNALVGAGVLFDVGSLEAKVELSGYLGTFSVSGPQSRGETQNDVGLSAGIIIPLISR